MIEHDCFRLPMRILMNPIKKVRLSESVIDALNEMIAADYASAKPLHRFTLRSGEDAEIRLSHKFYYVAVIRSSGEHYVIVIQAMYKEPPEEVRKRRLTEEWLKRERNKK